MSNPAKPSPRMGLRAPLSPVIVARRAPSPVGPEGSWNIFTEPSGFFVVAVTARRIWVALGLYSQFVGQALPLPIFTGNLDVKRAELESCQLPIASSVNLLA